VTTADRAYCWGSNTSGTLGDGGQTTRSQPRPVATRRYHNTAASQFYSCALTLAGKGECWGSNPRGELGHETTASTLTPGFMDGNLVLAQLSAGYSHACGVTTEGRAYCWGDNRVGEIGDGTTTQRLAPVPVANPM
jgi:alpha-tubulin suppressor-like RCC1 family protein